MKCKNCHQNLKYVNRETVCTSCSSPLHKDCAINDDGHYCDICYSSGVNKPKTTFEVPKTIRRSYIELYRKCPFAFYNEVVKGFAAPPTIYTQVGIDLHDLFDRASHGEINTVGEMAKLFQAMYDNYPDNFFPNEETKESMWIRSLTCIKEFFNILPTFPDKPFATEQTLQLSIGESLPNIQITMDRIDLVDGMLEVCDYKTGMVMTGKKISSDFQAPLYLYAIREHFKMPIRKFTFYYLKDGKTRTFVRIDDENYECTVLKRTYPINLTDTIRQVKKLFESIINQQFNVPNDYKSMYWQCNNCHHKDEGRCRGAEQEVWYQGGANL